jgi:hypothetical protein
MTWGKGSLGEVTATVAVVLALMLGLVSLRTADEAGASAAATSATTLNLAKQKLLRLHDLPLGYQLLDRGSYSPPVPRFGCTRIAPTDPQPRLASFLERYSPRGCFGVYYRFFQQPGESTPLFVGSAAAELGSAAAAKAGMKVSRELIAHFTDDEPPKEVQPPETVGEAARLFHWRDFVFFSEEKEAVSILVWRWGGSIGLVLASGSSFAAADRAAVELAQRQQKHLEAPRPYTRAERDDTQVPLEDPALQTPVYWLGSTFAPGPGFPPQQLAATYSETSADAERPSASLLYFDRVSGRPETVEIHVWSPERWKTQPVADRLPWGPDCPTTSGLSLPNGHATIYAGQWQGYRCGGRRRPDHYAVVVHLPGAVVTAQVLICEDCSGPLVGPYNSFEGVATIARGLSLRSRPAPVLVAGP